MKVLFITMRKILPLTDGATIYTHGILRYLNELGLETTLVSFFEDNDYNAKEIEELSRICKYVESVKLNWTSTALNLSFKYPNNIRKYTRLSLIKLLKEIKKRDDFDLVIIDHLQMFEYSKIFCDKKIILIEHNIESNIWLEYSEKKRGIIKKLVTRSAKMTLEYEKLALNKADHVISIAKSDADKLKKISGRNDIVIMHPYNVYDLLKTNEDIMKVSKKIIFIGSYGWYPNQEAAKFLATEVMPILRNIDPDIKLYLVGKDPSAEIIKYGQEHEDIIVTGTVDSVIPYVKLSDIFINAMSSGSGMNIKMMEAMGYGIPIVSSEHGVRGIDVRNDEHLLIYKDAEECAGCVNLLLNNRKKALEIRNNARKFYLDFIEPNDDVRRVFLN